MNTVADSTQGQAPPVIVAKKKNRLRKFVFLSVAGVSAVLLLIAALLALKDPILRMVVERNVVQTTGMRTTIGELRLGLTSSSLLLRDFRIFNPKEFGGALFFHVPEIYVELDAKQASEGVMHVKELRFNLAEVNVVKARNGQSNLDLMKESFRTNSFFGLTNLFGGDYAFDGIDRLKLTCRHLRYTDLQHPGNDYQTDLAVQDEEGHNLKTEAELNQWAVGLMTRIALREMLTPNPELKAGGGLQAVWNMVFKK